MTAVLPSAAPHAALDALSRRHGRQFRVLSHPGIERQLRPDQRYFLTATGHCDCGTVLGSDRRRAQQTPDASEARRRVQKGWSAARIARALAQKHERLAASDAVDVAARADELASWLVFIADVLDADQVSELGLLLHCYRGPLDEDIRLQDTVRIAVDATLGAALGAMREDVLYLFRRPG